MLRPHQFTLVDIHTPINLQHCSTSYSDIKLNFYAGIDARALMDSSAKNFNQHGRRVCSYRAWTGGAVIQPPLPSEPPIPPEPPKPTEPPTTPTIPPTDSVPVVVITAPANNASLSGFVTVKTTVTDVSEIREVYLLVDGVISNLTITAPYTFNLDTTKLADGAHELWIRAWNNLGKAGDAKITVNVANAPKPVEPPIPPVVEPPIPPILPKPCSISANPTSINIPRNSSGDIEVRLENLTGPTPVNVSGSDGQLTVLPASQVATPTKPTLIFKVRTKNKKQVRTITFQSGCGQVSVKVSVT